MQILHNKRTLKETIMQLVDLCYSSCSSNYKENGNLVLSHIHLDPMYNWDLRVPKL